MTNSEALNKTSEDETELTNFSEMQKLETEEEMSTMAEETIHSETSGEDSADDSFHDKRSGFGKLTQLLGKREIFPYQMLQNCSIRFQDPGPLVLAIEAGDREAFASGADACTKDEEAQFLRTCNAFERCAGFDFLEFAENNRNGLGLSVFGCLNALDNDVALEECTALVMNTGLWRPIGYFLEYNELMCPCFSDLHSDLPGCEFQNDDPEKALDGPAVKLSVCLLDQLCNIATPICRSEIASLNKCLPSQQGLEQSCEEIESHCKEEQSLLFTFPYPLAGATFPDRCQAVARENELQNAQVVGRYNAYRRQCVIEDDYVRDFGSPDEVEGDVETFRAKESTKVVEILKNMPWKTRILLGLSLYFLMAYLVALLYAYKGRQRWRRNGAVELQTLDSGSQFSDHVRQPYRDDF